MAGNARCQIWGPTAGKHHQKSVIWVTVFEDMNKFTNSALTFYTIESFKSKKCLSVKTDTGMKVKENSYGFTLLFYNLLHRHEQWNSMAYLDIAYQMKSVLSSPQETRVFYLLERVFVFSHLNIWWHICASAIVLNYTHVLWPDKETQPFCLPFGCLNIRFKIGRRPVADM